MSFRIVTGDYRIEVDTMSEFKAVLELLGLGSSMPKLPPEPEREAAIEKGRDSWPREALLRWGRKLTGKGASAVLALLEAPNGLTQDQLCHTVGSTPSRTALGGILAGPSRGMSRLKLPINWLSKKLEERNEQEIAVYRLAPSFRRAVEGTPGLLEELKKAKEKRSLDEP